MEERKRNNLFEIYKKCNLPGGKTNGRNHKICRSSKKKNTLENNIQNCENNIKMEDITKLLKEMRELMKELKNK